MEKYYIILAVVHIVSGFIARAIVRGKGYPNQDNHGFAWGLFLGLLGVLICLCKSAYQTPTQRRTTSSPNRYNTSRRPNSNRSYSGNSRTVTKQNFAVKLNTLNDSNDVKVQVSPQQRKLVSEAKSYSTNKRRIYSTVQSNEKINIDLSWSENLAELIEATEVVYTNAEMNCGRRLVSERFNYYINLHYRSFTAADLCHAKREEIMVHLNDLKRVISRLNDRSDFLRVDKSTYSQLIALRSNMYDLTDFLAKRRDTLNKQTATIRDKIKNECGERGQRWYSELMERAGK